MPASVNVLPTKVIVRTPIPLTRVDDRIGSSVIPIPPEKIAAIVITEQADSYSTVLPPDFVESLGYGKHYASLRPEDITLGDGPGRKRFSGRVTAASFLGAANRVTVEAAGARVAAMLPASIAVPAQGESVTLSFLPQDLHTMDGAQ